MMDVNFSYPSPNFNKRPQGTPIDMIVVHYTEIPLKAALARLCSSQDKVSAHYVIGEDGTVFSLVPEEMRAWHAGASFWDGREGINDYSIGIELDNLGDRPFTNKQMEVLIALCQELQGRYVIPNAYVVGHSDIAPDRKVDPGPFFDWKRFAAAGIGLWPAGASSSEEFTIHQVQQGLAQFGYKVSLTGREDLQTDQVMKAFHSRFCPSQMSEAMNKETFGLLQALLKLKT